MEDEDRAARLEEEVRDYMEKELDIWNILSHYGIVMKYCVVLFCVYWLSQRIGKAMEEEHEQEEIRKKVRCSSFPKPNVWPYGF